MRRMTKEPADKRDQAGAVMPLCPSSGKRGTSTSTRVRGVQGAETHTSIPGTSIVACCLPRIRGLNATSPMQALLDGLRLRADACAEGLASEVRIREDPAGHPFFIHTGTL